MDSLDVVASGQMLCFTTDAPFSCTVTMPAAGNQTIVEVDLYVLKATN